MARVFCIYRKTCVLGILPVLMMLYIVKYFAADLEVFAEGVCNRISLRSMCTVFAMRNLLASHFVMECVPCFSMQSMYGLLRRSGG